MTQQPPQKPTFEERLTDAALKITVIGSGAYALYNLFLEDLPKATIAGLVSFGSGLMTSFGHGLMATLGDRMKQRGEASGKIIDQAIDNTVEKTLTRLTGFHQQYLEALKIHCHNLKVEGYKGRLPRLVLEEVYVPLRINPGKKRNNPLQIPSLKIWDLLPKVNHPDKTFIERLIAVIADPGYGKTTLLRFLTLSFSNQTYTEHGAKELIPILLLFRDFYPRIQSRIQPSLPQLIVEQVQQLPRCSALRTSEPWVRNQMMQGKCLVMMDGLDEVPESQRETVSQWANWQMQNYPSQFILTSRPHGYDSSLFEGVQRIDILDFNNDQKRTFINQWYRFITWELTWKPHWEESQYAPNPQKRLSREQVEAESNAEAEKAAVDLSRQLFAEQSLTALAKNPLLITIIATTHEASEKLPTRRVYLYKEIFKLLLEYRPNRRDTRLTIPSAEDNQLILQRLAVELTEAGITQFSAHQGAEWIKDRLAEVHPKNSLTPKKFLREIQQVSGLLAGGEGNLYEFTHKTFQEYLTAVELGESKWGLRKVMEQFDNEDWREVVYFFATLTDPTPFINAVLQEPTNSYTRGLAQRLANESARVDENLKKQLLNTLQQQEPESAKVRLEQRFRNLEPLSEITAISDCITWGEYMLFIEAQNSKAFHSCAEPIMTEFSYWNNPVDGIITWEDARWFCAWLSTQTNFAPDEGVYDYYLPTLKELEAISGSGQISDSSLLAPQFERGSGSSSLYFKESAWGDLAPWTTDPTRLGNALRVVRQQIPERYNSLMNYLANGQWKEANQETDKQMLEAVGKEAVERGYLKLEEIRNLPCDDLNLIDQLWVKFSGGKFGFSVQKQIWVGVGGKLDFGKDYQAAQEAYQKMSAQNGWRVNNTYISKVAFDISLTKGHLPLWCESIWVEGVSVLFSRIVKCSR
ncbi:MAG: GUN4 domain-containing protein [Pseudanabaenales cyanobacterium]|nr:GUN4 domain-containing protein [Pseudanabaenales cyanobacterium]